MTFTVENIFFLGAVLIFASIVISKWGYRFGVPTLLLFLFTGMLFGSDGLGLEFNSHEDAQLIGMLSLSVILFFGGMDTKRRDIGLTLPMSMLLAATVSSTDSASVFNLLRIGLKHRLRPLLELESGLNAPMAYVLTVKRGNSFIVPNGQLELRPGDILLTIAQQSMMGTPAKQ